MQAEKQSDGPPELSKQEKQLTNMSDEKLEKVLEAIKVGHRRAGSAEAGDVSREHSTTSDTKESKVSDTEQIGASSAGNSEAEAKRRQTEAEKV